MCQNCVDSGRMTQEEMEMQRELRSILGESAMTPEDMAMVAMLSNPDTGRIILDKFLTALEMAGWSPAVVKNQDGGQYGFAFVHASGQGGALILAELSEKAAKAIEEQFKR